MRPRFRVAVALGLGCLLVPGMAGCEYAPLAPLPSMTPTLTPPGFSERSPEEQEAFDARLAQLTVEVEEQLGVLPEAAGGGTGGMRAGSGTGIGSRVTQPGQYSVLTACSPTGQATLSISPESGTGVIAAVPCGERAETPVQLDTGWVTISLEPLGSEVSMGATYLLPPGVTLPSHGMTPEPAG